MTQKKKTPQNKTGLYVTLSLIIVAILIALVWFRQAKDDQNEKDKLTVPKKINQGEVTFVSGEGQRKASILVEIADDDYTRAYGLMFRQNLPENQGMLFIFEEDDYQSFWMKNTPIPLDMIFANSQNEIVHIEKYAEPYSLRSYPSRKPAMYVIEVVAGFTDRYEIEAGDRITWRRFTL